ncbi:MAG: DNA ligase D [Bryobacterales bacterium]|nr:DNA ligase D [Bryobacterales bacterium]
MSLKKYSEKRHFDRTPEPEAGKPHKHSGALQYCVQRHHATRLHYDFRLEAGGALKSWAVPKGPTLDPGEKRLAMMVEDHPLEYGGFEGVIPKGNYGAGSVMLWDRGTYELLDDASADEQLARGDFKFHLNGEKLRGDFALVRMKRGKGNEWLLLKKKDQFAQPGWDVEDQAYSVLSGRTQEEIAQQLAPLAEGKKQSPAARAHHKDRSSDPLPLKGTADPMPKNISPMLAQIGRGDPPAGDEWMYEIKWDGVRAICYVDNGKLRMISRNGNLIDRQYPELSVLPHHVKARQAILDGEIAALDERGIPSFERLQRRITVADASAIATLSRHYPVVLYVFDLLYVEGRDLRGTPLMERKRLLKEILEPDNIIRYSEHFTGNGPQLLEAVKRQGIEGIIGKRASSLYEPRRTSDWVKYKNTNSDSFVLCGFTKGEREYFGALVLGIYDRGKLKWAGNVGTGFDHKTIKAIYEKLAPLATPACTLEPEKLLPKEAAVTWTRPELVCEVRYLNWTEDGRLRAPVWMGFRPDVDPTECVRNSTADDKNGSSAGQLLDPNAEEQILTIGRHRLKFTNLNKIFYPKDGYKKRDLLNYYDAVAPLIVPHLKDRPLSLKRYPNGIDEPFFFQKEVAPSFPKWLRMELADDGIRYVIGEDRATLLFLVNLGCIDHNPWMSRMGSLDNPDYILFDLDAQECGFAKIVEAALLVRRRLEQAELEGYPKTTGGDGMHVIVPLEPRYTYEQARSFAELISILVARERPDLFTTPRSVSRREKGKVYFDWAQVGKSKTISAPYVVRAYPGGPVATPLSWPEVTPKLHPEQFHIGNALARFERVGDLFEGVLNNPQKLERAVEKLSEGA